MSLGGLTFEAGQIVIREGARVTFTTAGTPVNLLPASSDLNIGDPVAGTGYVDLPFPDFTMDNAYHYRGLSVAIGNPPEYAQSFLSIVPQSWDNFAAPIDLGAVPHPDVDFLDVQVMTSRVLSPTRTMYKRPVPKCVPENMWFDMGTSSGRLERALNMSRVFTVEMVGDRVKLKAQQSFGPHPWGWHPSNTGNTSDGIGYWTYGSVRGTPVYSILRHPASPTLGGARVYYRGGGGQLPLTSAGASYASTWRMYFKIAFGRRS